MRKPGKTADPSTESAEEHSFYGRWSRRKQRAREGQPPGQDVAALDTGEPAPESPAPEREVPLLTDADMPSLESLDADSDYSGFLSEGVSDKLRNKALKKYFLSPQFNIVDGLDDYCEDFTNFELLGDIVTADMRYEREYEAQRALEREQQEQLAQRKLREQQQEQTAALEADADNGAEDQDREQPTSLDADADAEQSPSVTAEEDSLAQGEVDAEIEESLTAIPEIDGDHQDHSMT